MSIYSHFINKKRPLKFSSVIPAFYSSLVLVAFSIPALAMDKGHQTEFFETLDRKSQLIWLREKVIQHRRSRSNISVTGKTDVANYFYNAENRVVSDQVLLQANPELFYLKRINDSYKIRVNPLPDQLETNVRYAITTVSHDSSTGRTSQLDEWFTQGSGSVPDRNIGSINAERGTAAYNCLFYSYLGDKDHAVGGECDMGRRFLSAFDETEIIGVDRDTSLVKVVFPSILSWEVKATCTQFFDLSKDGMLVKMVLREDRPSNSTGESGYYTVTTEALSVRKISDVYIPEKLKVTAWCTNKPEQVTVQVSVLSDISIDELTNNDLTLHFPPGTLVRDRINGKNYDVGKNGEKLKPSVPRLDSLDPVPQVEIAPTPLLKSPINLVLKINGLILVAIVVYFVYRRRKC